MLLYGTGLGSKTREVASSCNVPTRGNQSFWKDEGERSPISCWCHVATFSAHARRKQSEVGPANSLGGSPQRAGPSTFVRVTQRTSSTTVRILGLTQEGCGAIFFAHRTSCTVPVVP